MKQLLFKRKIFKEILPWLDKPQAIVITGMRRTGKTTLARQLLDEVQSANKLFLDLEDLDNRELFNMTSYDSILLGLAKRGLSQSERMYIVLDEIQLAPDIASQIKYLIDHYKIKFIVTGSSSYYLKNLFSQSLAGRKMIFELFPLDFGEYLTFKQVSYIGTDTLDLTTGAVQYSRLSAYYEDYIKFGGFPQVVLENSEGQKYNLLKEVINSYINVDVRALADFASMENLEKTIKLLAVRAGSRLEIGKLAQSVGVATVTMKAYLEFLEKTYLIFRVPVFSGSKDKEVVKAGKIYYCDTGLARVLADISSGAQFENTVYLQLRRFGEVNYYAKHSGAEIDFILNKQIALEAKETPSLVDVKKLLKLANKLGIKNTAVVGRYKPAHFTDFVWAGQIV